ncbi:MAG TPA: YlxR family protein [Clostridiales bacterium]|nr:YlxR family protein [Clostridiales bacterium]
MKQKRIPLRKCTGCGEMKPKKELVRVVKSPDIKDDEGQVLQKGEISLDYSGKKPGRGAYVCSCIECLQTAQKARRLEKTLSCFIPPEIYEKLKEGIRKSEE